ncbi:hypothetical protein JL100_012145 [Skermanella mucosa]|uniref:hypothetical protein n=1 Tax=Skermanella mucosa TaxID=1789672 RepID=UPI00192A9319|nr:hypothetical protein [Skermanella mucosa]UEM23443.1 hypothetical protein JL100_012145 [Skermanella mucosa]
MPNVELTPEFNRRLSELQPKHRSIVIELVVSAGTTPPEKTDYRFHDDEIGTMHALVEQKFKSKRLYVLYQITESRIDMYQCGFVTVNDKGFVFDFESSEDS